MDSGISDVVYQDHVLPHVSRTFALTIPQLPAALRIGVTNAYLLCRIADTIEDEPALSPRRLCHFYKRFMAALTGRSDARVLAAEIAAPALGRHLGDGTRFGGQHAAGDQRDGRIEPRPTHRHPSMRGAHVLRMPRFQDTASLRGLPRLVDLDDYCYYVAGVVGDMLTELFCEYSPAIARRRAELQSLSVSFAQGLQMTNILKDVWRTAAAGPAGCRKRYSRVTAWIWRRCRRNRPIRVLQPACWNWWRLPTDICAMRSNTRC